MKPKILIVDSERIVRDLLIYSLNEGNSFDVSETGSGIEAVRLARTLQPALILIDIMMPDLPGLEVCKRIKGEESTKNIKVFLMSARGRPEEKNEGISAGAEEFITKPFGGKTILKKVGEYLNE